MLSNTTYISTETNNYEISKTTHIFLKITWELTNWVAASNRMRRMGCNFLVVVLRVGCDIVARTPKRHCIEESRMDPPSVIICHSARSCTTSMINYQALTTGLILRQTHCKACLTSFSLFSNFLSNTTRYCHFSQLIFLTVKHSLKEFLVVYGITFVIVYFIVYVK